MKDTDPPDDVLFKAVDLSKNQVRDLHSSQDVALYIENVAKFYLNMVSISSIRIFNSLKRT